MLAGHRSTEDTQQKGWPRVSPRPTPPVSTAPPIGRCQAVTATVPTFSWLPENYGILHDASWCPKTRRCGGAVAVFCPVTLRYQVYRVPIPLRLDNAYTAELYTAWVALTARGPPTQAARGARPTSCRPLLPPEKRPREPVPRRPPSAGVVSRGQLGPDAWVVQVAGLGRPPGPVAVRGPPPGPQGEDRQFHPEQVQSVPSPVCVHREQSDTARHPAGHRAGGP